MSKILKLTAALCFTATVITSAIFHCCSIDLYLTLAITFGTTTYHLGIRLLVGALYSLIMKNQADYTKKWYQVHSWESKLYSLLKVKTWKNKLPTYDPESFSRQKHTWDEIAQAMCQSELVHETNMVLSFLPLIASFWFGSFFVFLITSLCGAAFDLCFVVIQRYNRSRIMRIIRRQR